MSVALPNFIIGGAMKSATRSIHGLLNTHPDIRLPEHEQHFFTGDDTIDKPEMFFVKNGRPLTFDSSEGSPFYNRYVADYEAISGYRWRGDGSPSYLHSEIAPARIARMIPDVKLIFTLRHPVERTYSHYWHNVKTGLTACSFEEALKRHPTLITRSSYAHGLERYYRLFDPSQIHVSFFEDFRADPATGMASILDFLGAPAFSFDGGKAWNHKTEYPRSHALTFLLIRMSKGIVDGRFYDFRGLRSAESGAWRSKLYHLWRRNLLDRSLTSGKAPPMNPETRSWLSGQLSERNAGLSDLLGRDLEKLWSGFRNFSAGDHAQRAARLAA